MRIELTKLGKARAKSVSRDVCDFDLDFQK